MKIKNIVWASDEADVNLPVEVVTSEDIEKDDYDAIADYLSDNYGFLVESFSVYNGRNWTISEIEDFTEREAKALSEEHAVIKGYDIYFADFGEYFGYSCLVFKDGHHIYHANDYQLHHRSKKDINALKELYVKKLGSILFTEAEIGLPLTDYDEYKRRDYFLRNYYIMQVDNISMFGIRQTKEEKSRYNRQVARMHFDPVSFAYVKDKDFVEKHMSLFNNLVAAKVRMSMDYEYQKKAFLAEMYNHEYQINWQADFDTLSAFGNLEYARSGNELESYFEQLEFNEVQRKAYIDAIAEYYKEVNA